MRNSQPLIAVSACLLGKAVRYDGASKPLAAISGPLAAHCQLLELCPEVAIGMGVPRPPIQVVLEQGRYLARGITDPSTEFSEALRQHATAHQQQHPLLCGYLLKARSPSCGVNNTPIYQAGQQAAVGSGIFARQVTQQQPWLPICSEEELTKPPLRDHFFQRLFLQQHILQCQNAEHRRQLHEALGLTLLSYGHDQPVALDYHDGEHFNQQLMGLVAQPPTAAQQQVALQRVMEMAGLDHEAADGPTEEWRATFARVRELTRQHPQLANEHYLVKNEHEWQLRFVVPFPE